MRWDDDNAKDGMKVAFVSGKFWRYPTPRLKLLLICIYDIECRVALDVPRG